MSLRIRRPSPEYLDYVFKLGSYAALPNDDPNRDPSEVWWNTWANVPTSAVEFNPQARKVWCDDFDQACTELGVELPMELITSSPSSMVRWLCAEYHRQWLNRELSEFQLTVLPTDSLKAMWGVIRNLLNARDITIDSTTTWEVVWKHVVGICYPRIHPRAV